jgi:hypothetical protein
MADTREQARLREHLAELGRTAKLIGKDVAIDTDQLGRKIDRIGRLTGKEARYALYDIQDGLTDLGHQVQTGARRLPGALSTDLQRAGGAIGDGAVAFGRGTRDAVVTAGRKTRTGTQNALARAAGVKKTPMKEWQPTDSD